MILCLAIFAFHFITCKTTDKTCPPAQANPSQAFTAIAAQNHNHSDLMFDYKLKDYGELFLLKF